MNTYLVIDIGASSGRLIVVEWNKTLKIHEIHRFENSIHVVDRAHEFLDFDVLMKNVSIGMDKAFNQFPNIKSIGIDTWGVDYGYINQEGDLIRNPYFYRSQRTQHAINQVHQRLSAKKLYQKTGIQSLYFNTIFQMYADKLSEDIDASKVSKMLMLPDLIGYMLTGKYHIELTNLSTTGLYAPVEKSLIAEANDLTFGKDIFPKIVMPGQTIVF